MTVFRFVNCALLAVACVGVTQLSFPPVDDHEYLALVNSLKNQHIVILGDSLSRYHYVSLVYHLRHGQPMSQHMHPSPVREKTWKTWNDFYVGTNGLLHPELCDCFRPEEARPDNMNENRYFYDNKHNISVTYYQFFGNFVHGHWSPPGSPAYLASLNKPNVTCPNPKFVPPYWKYEPHELYANHMAYLTPRPTIIVMNAGYFGNTFDNSNYTAKVLQSFHKKVDMFIWRTTTSMAGGDDKIGRGSDKVCEHKEEVICMNMTWTKTATREQYWDSIHFIEPVYTMFNMQLAGMVRNHTAGLK